MRVAVVSPYALDRYGGVQSHTRQLVAHLRESGVDAWLVGPGRDGPGGFEHRVGGTVQVRANRSEAPVAVSPLAAARLQRVLAGADLVHVHEPWVPLAGWAALVGDAPRVLTFHADPSTRVRRAYAALARPLRTLVGRAGAVTAVSGKAAGAIAPFCPDPVIIPNAVDRTPGAVGDRGPTVAFVGRDEERKGLGVALAAWPEVLAAVPRATLRVVSDTRRAALPGVEFLGPLDDAGKLDVLGSSAVYVAPNTGGESFGITIAEAMAAGCAVVASDLDAFVDVVGGAGVHVPVRDHRRLAAEVVRLLQDPELLAGMQVAALARVEAFTWEAVVPRYLELYRSVVG